MGANQSNVNEQDKKRETMEENRTKYKKQEEEKIQIPNTLKNNI